VARIFSKVFCIALMTLVFSSVATAAGLGRLTVNSGLGQPLRAEIEVVSLQPGEADTLAAALASVETFKQANVEFNSALLNIRFAIERRANNQYVIAMTSTQPMNEPFIDLLIELSWNAGRLVREYTFLLDPPEIKPATPASAPPIVPPQATAIPAEAPKPVATPAQQPESAATVSAKPPAAAAAKPAAKPAGQYEVKRGDTLAKIANANRVSGASLAQMLSALYQGNPDAFDGKNMNRLRAGRILNLPSEEDVRGVSDVDARRLMTSQAAEYAEFQRSVGAAVAAAPARADSARQASGRISEPTAEKPAAKGAAKDQLRLSKPDDAKGAGSAAAKGDDLAAKERALREANERIALLEKNVQDLKKLSEVKSAAGAQAQQQAAAKDAAPAKAEAKASPPTKAEAPKTEAQKSEPAKSEPAKPEAAKAEPGKEAPKSDAPKSEAAQPDAAKSAEPAKPAEGAAPDAAKEAPKAAPKPAAPPPPPPPEPSLVDELLDNPIALGGGGGVVVLLLGYGAYAWRRKKKAAEMAVEDADISIAPVAAASVASVAMDSGTDSEAPSAGAAASSGGGEASAEDIDPVAEADVYMAYGRDTQAEEILKEALGKDSGRLPVWLKLLEIYANRKDLGTFESTARDVQTLTGGQGPEWEKAQAMGLQLDPSNTLYGGSGEAAADMGSTQILDGLGDSATVVVDPDLTLDDGAAGGASAAVDFDLDLGAEPAADTASGASVDLDLGAAPAEAEAPAETGSGLDFDLGMGGDTPAAEPASDFSPQGTLIMDQAAPAADTSTADGDSGASIDFDLGTDTPEAPALELPAAEPAPVVTADAGGGMDFNLSLDDAPAAPAAPEPEAPALDLSSISLDLGGDTAASAAPMDAKWQEVATKLDLAKAYDEMGDKDGARDLLNEVLAEGDAAQKQQAETMLAALG
jgi:pilus assembly protein FimV